MENVRVKRLKFKGYLKFEEKYVVKNFCCNKIGEMKHHIG